MEVTFADSELGTVGIEWELGLIDRHTRRLVPEAHTLLEAVADTPQAPHIHRELLQNTVELVTGVHHTIPSALTQLHELSALLRRVSPAHVGLFCAGTHPFESAATQPYTQNDRYRRLIDRTQWWGRQMLIYGVHVHVGVDRQDAALPIVEQLLRYQPHLQALSASSPWWDGRLTGYASNRSMMFQQLPTAGIPPELPEWDAYERFVADEFQTGVVEHINELRYDVRPSPGFGTVESRICDGLPTLYEIGALAALTQCLVVETRRSLTTGTPLTRLPRWHIQENKWRACRYGLAADIITGPDNSEAPVVEEISTLLSRLEPLSEELGCADELRRVDTLLHSGASYQRQLHVASTPGCGPEQVVDSLLTEFETERPAGI